MANDKTPIKLIKGVYVNREFSWIKFNLRVLEQSVDEDTPVLERGKFLSIFTSNLDEFFMVRMGSLYNEDKMRPEATDNKTRLTFGMQLKAIAERVPRLYEMREHAFTHLKRDLSEAGINILTYAQLSEGRKDELKKMFNAKVLPLLSPMVIDAKHPLFRFENLRCYMLYKLKKNDHTMIGVMEFSDKLDALYRFAGGKKFTAFRSSEFIPVFAKAGTILPLSGDEGNSADNPEKLVLWVFGGNGSFELYEDGTEHGNTDQAITRLKTELVSIKEKDPRFPDGTTVKKQILTVSAEKTAGAAAVIPPNRVIRAVFRDLPFGFVTVYKNGRETDFEEIDSHCLTAEFRFSAGNEYRVEMTFAEKTLAERLKDFARETLLSAEGRNSLKNRVYNELVKAATAEEFKQTVDKSDLPNISKLRLKETLL